MRIFVRHIFPWAVVFFFAWLLQIDHEKEYGWFMGFIHGWLLVPN